MEKKVDGSIRNIYSYNMLGYSRKRNGNQKILLFFILSVPDSVLTVSGRPLTEKGAFVGSTR
jgi:hypothetical protein